LVLRHQSCEQAAPLVLNPTDACANGQALAPLRGGASPDTAETKRRRCSHGGAPQVATAEIGFLQSSFSVREEQLVFASRWPENFPSAQTLNAED